MDWEALWQSCLDAFKLFTWQDGVEIVVFTLGAYAIIKLLAQDTQKKLLLCFYSYCLLCFAAFYLDIAGLGLVLLLSTPVVATLFIVMHQQTLQKNFVALASLTPEPEQVDQWLPELIQATLSAVNTGKSTVIILERSNSVGDLVSGGCTLNAPITPELLALLTQATNDQHLTLLATQTGKIKAYNPVLNIPFDTTWLSDEVQLLARITQDSVILTEKTDAIVWILSAQTRFFTLTISGKLYERLSASSLMAAINRYIANKQLSEKDSHEFSPRHHSSSKRPRA